MLGDLRQRLSEIRPPAATWHESDIPSLMGKVCLVTGGNTGIGKETCRALLEHDARVYLGSRSPEKGRAAVDELKQKTGKSDIHFLQIDLANLKQVKSAAKGFAETEQRLDLLFASGGVMFPPLNSETSDGLDLQFGTNTVGHYALIRHLLPLLLETAKTAPGGSVRVISTSSSGHEMAPSGGIDWDNTKLAGYWVKPRRNAALYGQSKLGNIIVASELSRRYADQGILSVSLNPGNIHTELTRHIDGASAGIARFGEFIGMLATPPLGASTQLYAGTSPDVTIADGGAYFIPWARKGKTLRSEAHDEAIGKRLWELCDKLMKDAGAAADD